ncbi:MAG: FkbM family methyltransferase [Deltaproteobacteria bacterium]|nr:FkbM family methyltransferase [Deltaproteobacteria bacterium]
MRAGSPLLAVLVLLVLADATTHAEEGRADASPGPAASPATTVDILWTGDKLYSYGNEELIIRDFFQDRREGVFVDIGCAWPIKSSNTYYLEKHLGWSGIAVDGLGDYAESWRTSRPRSKFLNFLVTERSDNRETFYKAGTWGNSTAEKDVARHLNVVGELQVPGITLDDLLARNGVRHVDLLSIDVEGHTAAVLAGFDLQRWKPELVCVEDDGTLVVPWFKERGYAPIARYRLRDVANWYFAPQQAARAADARETARGREEADRREKLLASEPLESPVQLLMNPRYILGPDGTLRPNLRWQEAMAKANATAAERAAAGPTPTGSAPASATPRAAP